jgi:putative acetyltransferase
MNKIQKTVPIQIRTSTDADLPGILAIHRAAFPDESVADLTAALMSDPSTRPLTSLLAMSEGKPVGHVLFTAARFVPATAHRASILAPLAVAPAWQRRGIGTELVSRGLTIQAQSGVNLLFVLGHPAYYPRFGFAPAGERGFSAPYPIPEQHAEAWMVLALDGGLPTAYRGSVQCAKALDCPEHWLE